MIRFVVSLFFGAVVGLVIGLYLGWVQFPVQYINSPANALATRYQEEYTLMVASGYLIDRDANTAIQRLTLLGVDNVPVFVQETTERYITNSRDVSDIRRLVALSEGLGRLTPIMEAYRQVNTTGQNP